MDQPHKRDIVNELDGIIPPDTAPPSDTSAVQSVEETTVPPVPTSAQAAPSRQHHEVMGQVLTQAIQKGKEEVPHTPDRMVRKPAELESWRVFKIMSEFVEGFEILRKYGLAATFFGSVRTTLAPRYYEEAAELAGLMAKSGFAIITGGSAGIMEAANKGAYEAGGASVGLNIRLDDSQGFNKYLTDSLTFEHFFVRKVMLAFASEVYVCFPGGYGTLDEFSEIVTLVQTGKIRRIPIVLYGKDFWQPYVDLFTKELYEKFGTISQSDLELFKLVDTVDEAFAYIAETTGCTDVRRG